MMTGFPNSLIYVLLVSATFSADHLAKATTSLQCNEIESQSAIMRLRKYLFCDYDQSIRPTINNQNATSIHISLLPKFIEVDEDTSTIQLHTWTSLAWKDVHLTWDPSQYEGIHWLQIKSYEVWIPDVVPHTAGSGNDEIRFTGCWLHNKGNIQCVPSDVYTIHCSTDHTWWPYETMNCTAQFASWSYSIEEVELLAVHYEVEGLLTMAKYEKNLAWEVLRSYMTERVEVSKYGRNYTTKLMSHHVILKRYSSPFNTSYVVPALVLMIMTLLTLWLEPKSVERMIIANLNFVCHLLWMGNLLWRIPYTGINRPRIIILFQTSLILSTLSLILTSVLRHIQELTAVAPVWISSSIAFVLRSKVGHILLVSILDPKVSAQIEADAEDNTDLVSSSRKGVAWQYVTLFIGWIAFLAVLIAYFVSLFLYLPTSNSGKSFILNS